MYIVMWVDRGGEGGLKLVSSRQRESEGEMGVLEGVRAGKRCSVTLNSNMVPLDCYSLVF